MRKALLCTLLILPVASSLPALELYMRDVILVEEDEIRIGDVVRMLNGEGSPYIEAQLPAARSISVRPLSLVSVNHLGLIPPRVVRQHLEDLYDLIIIGGRSAIIPLKPFPQRSLWFYQSLLRFLDASDGGREGRIEVEILEPPQLPERRGELTFSLQRVERKLGYLAGELELGYRIELSQESFSGHIRIKVRQYLPIPVLRSPLLGGSSLTHDMLVLEERDLNLVLSPVLGPSDNPENYILKRSLPEGSLLCLVDLKEKSGVNAGQQILIRFRRGAVRLEMPGRATRSGKIGDTVSVMPRDLTRQFRGVVVDTEMVEVEIP